MRTTPAPRENPEDQRRASLDAPDGDAAASRSGLYELWQPEELRRHVAILEAELARMAQSQAELEALRNWKAQVERSRAWRVASNLSRIRRLPSRIARSNSQL